MNKLENALQWVKKIELKTETCTVSNPQKLAEMLNAYS